MKLFLLTVLVSLFFVSSFSVTQAKYKDCWGNWYLGMPGDGACYSVSSVRPDVEPAPLVTPPPRVPTAPVLSPPRVVPIKPVTTTRTFIRTRSPFTTFWRLYIAPPRQNW